MPWLLFLGGLVGVAGLIFLNVQVVLCWSAQLRKLGYRALSWLHNRAEAAVLARPDAAPAASQTGKGVNLRVLTSTRLGIWSLVSSFLFLASWMSGWVSPKEPLGFITHLFASWMGGIVGASFGFGAVWAVGAAWRMGLAQLFASRTGLRRIWITSMNLANPRLLEALRQAAGAAPRIEILDFTGYELIAKGDSDDGGVLAKLLARCPEKEARILLFNPSVQEIDPDRQHVTVLQSQLSAMEMSREAFESKLRATFERIDALNQKRQKPIEVRLYSEKPCFRAVVAGDVSFFGAIDPSDAAGELVLYEAARKTNGPSMFSGARSHFLRVWGDSLPVLVEATSTVEEEAPVGPTSPVPRSRSRAR